MAQVSAVEFGTATLTDISSSAVAAVDNAFQYCIDKVRHGTPEEALECLRKGDSRICGYFEYSLAGQVGGWLGALDDGVQKVFLCCYDATPEDVCLGTSQHNPLVHLIVWTERKTAALQSLVESLDRELAQAYGDMVGRPDWARLLDVQMVDDTEVQNRVGYGAVVSSVHNPPLPVWTR